MTWPLSRTITLARQRPRGAADHARYFEAFIEALIVKEVVLVLRDWGSALGLDSARRHQDRVRGLALMEFVWPNLA
jgi:haloalkane dehalogenase